MKKYLISALALVMCVMFIPSVKAEAAKTPEKSGNFVFANGTPITIKEKDGGTVVAWEGADADIDVDENTTVFGGGHKETDGIDFDSTSITMESGKVKNIVGGGLHKSHIGSTFIFLKGGEVTGGIVGGGASSFSSDTCSWYSGNKEGATTIVDDAFIMLAGGKAHSVFGGEGISYTKKTEVNVNSGEFEYVTAGGSNGFTDDAKVSLAGTGAKVGKLQTVNRGTVEGADVYIAGGTVDNLYIGGEDAGDVTGTLNSVKVNIVDGEVKNLVPGKNKGTTLTQGSVNMNVSIVEGTVGNEGSLDPAVFAGIKTLAKFYIDDVPYTVEYGTKLSELPELDKIKTREGYAFSHFATKDDNKEYSEDTVIENGTRLITVFNKVSADANVAVPKTFDGIVGVVILGIVGIIGFIGTSMYLRRKEN